MRIAICASFSFYQHVVQIEEILLELGHDPRVPKIAASMKAAGDFTKDPLQNASGEFSDYSQKTVAMREHFAEINQADAILVVNDEKHGKPNYIGPNVLMEMAVAFALHKNIYLLNEIPEHSPFSDEIHALEVATLGGDVSRLQPKAREIQ